MNIIKRGFSVLFLYNHIHICNEAFNVIYNTVSMKNNIKSKYKTLIYILNSKAICIRLLCHHSLMTTSKTINILF